MAGRQQDAPQRQPEAKSKPRTSSEERARLRRNQQNSRARKQAYVGDLERKWANCVAQGAQASNDLQREAHRVLAENKELRAMLQELGVDHTSIQQRLASRIHRNRLLETSSSTAFSVPCNTDCRRPDAAAQMRLSNDPGFESFDVQNSPPITDWTTLNTGQGESNMPLWDVTDWLQDLTDLKDAFGSQDEVNQGTSMDLNDLQQL